MPQIHIHDIGPIKEIDVTLNRFNVFIGPQSSGKSTIAKILSFCQWLEKDCVLRQYSSHINDAFIKRNLIDYHNISDYVRDDSSFVYSGASLDISFTRGKLTVVPNDGFPNAKISKNAYIPAERTVVAVPGIFSTKMPENYLASFIDDWQYVRTKYVNGDNVSILNLGESYFYDEKHNADMLTLKGGGVMHLSQASSGLQSVTPLCVYMAYLTQWIYTHDEDKSSDTRKMIWDSAVAKSIFDGVDMPLDVTLANPSLKDRFQHLSDSLLNAPVSDDDDVDAVVKKIKELSEALGKPKFSNIVIEEPELNLFPRTQANLIYFILSKVKHTRDNMTITTHSPYILYALNNCILANLVKDRIPDDVLADIDVPDSAWLDGHAISVWELRDGYIMNSEGVRNVPIQDENGLIRNNYFDRVMHNIMSDFNILLNFK